MEKVDQLDLKILKIISVNARIPFKDVAAVCGVSRAAIHQRVQRLIEAGVITGSGYNVCPKSIGYSTCTYVGIKLERGSMYKGVAEQLEKIPEIVECHFTTGPYCSLSSILAIMNTLWTCSITTFKRFTVLSRPKRLFHSNKALVGAYPL